MPCTGPPIWSQLLLIWNDLFTGRLQVLQGWLRTGAHTYEQAMQVTPGRERLQTLVNSADYYFGMGDRCANGISWTRLSSILRKEWTWPGEP